MDVSQFSAYVNEFLKNIDAPHESVIDSEIIDAYVYNFIETVNANYLICQNPTEDLLELTVKIKKLSDSGASKNAATRMNNIFERTFSSEKEKLQNGILKLVDRLSKSNLLHSARSYCALLPYFIGSEPSPTAMGDITKELQEILKDKKNLRALMKCGTPELQKQVALLAQVTLPVVDEKLERFKENLTSLIDVLFQVDKAKYGESLLLIDTTNGYEKAVESTQAIFRDPTSLLLLLEHGQKGFIEVILPAGSINFASADRHGNTLLHEAANMGFSQAARYMIDTGVSIETQNSEKQTPVMIAATRGHLNVLKSLLRAGASPVLDADFLGRLGANPAVSYLKRKYLKDAEVNVVDVNEMLMMSHYQPRGIRESLGIANVVPTVPDAAKPVIEQVLDGINVFAPVDGVKLGAQVRVYLGKKSEIKQQIQEIEEQIILKEVQIQEARVIDKSARIEQKKQLEQTLKHLIELSQRENREVKARIVDKTIGLHQKAYFAATVLQKGSNALLGLKGFAAITGVLSSGLATFECWSILGRVKTRQNHLVEVRASLEKAKHQLNTLRSNLDPSSLEYRLISLKLGSIETRVKEIQEKRFDLDIRKVATRATLAGTSIACTLMLYSTAAFYGKTPEGQNFFDPDEVAEWAGNLSLFSELLPLIAAPIATGACWMWMRGVEALRGKKETVREKEMRLESKRAVQLTKEQKRLADEHEGVVDELYKGIEISLGVLSVPEVGSARYNELRQRVDEIKTRQIEVTFELEKLATASRLRMTSTEVANALQDIENDLVDEDNIMQMRQILKAAKIDVTGFDSNPISCILEYLK